MCGYYEFIVLQQIYLYSCPFANLEIANYWDTGINEVSGVRSLRPSLAVAHIANTFASDCGQTHLQFQSLRVVAIPHAQTSS